MQYEIKEGRRPQLRGNHPELGLQDDFLPALGLSSGWALQGTKSIIFQALVDLSLVRAVWSPSSWTVWLPLAQEVISTVASNSLSCYQSPSV